MLDLSYLLGRGKGAAEPLPPPDLDDAYARYVAETRRKDPRATPMSENDFERYSLGSSWLSAVRDVAKKVVQTCRLVVGIHDYDYYLDHMRSKHPEATPFTREEFYRYCLEARFPSGDRVGSRCPC